MDKIKPRTLSGFMELPPDKQVQMDKMRAVLAETYARYGFTPLDTPAIEAAEVLLAKGGGETEKQIYRFTKGDSDLALRFDLTVPLAKYVAANYGQLTFPFRRYQIGKVWRGERAQRGRFREFYQADIDIIGDGALDILNEAEIPAIIYDTFTRLGLHRFRIRVNNRKVLNGFFAILGLSEQAGDVLRTIDKLDKIGADKVRALLTDTCGVTSEQADEILRFIACPGTSADKLAFLEQYRGRNETFDTGLDELRTVVGYLPAFGVPEENFELDLTIARGLDYYTGTVYETVLLDHPEVGSICSGGRYDDLAVLYEQVPARRRHLHRPDAPVLHPAGAEHDLRRRAHRAGGRAHSADDGRSVRGRGAGVHAARRRPARAALQRAQEIQGQDRLCRQARHPVCDLPRRG